MKQKSTLVLATIMAVGICSCSEDESILDSQNSSQAIAFDVPFVSKSTRALIDNKNIASQTLKVYGQKAPKGTTTWTSVFDGTELRQVDGKWTPSKSAIWYEYQDYRFVAVCPSDAPFSYNTTTGFVALTAVPSVQEANAGTDYLVSNQYTTTTNSQDRKAVSFTMIHMLSKLTMGIMKTSDFAVRVNSSKLWMPKETITATYQADCADIDRFDSRCWTYSTFENGSTAPSKDYTTYPCFTDNLALSAEVANGTTYLVAPHADLNLYIDLDFDVLDANGKILRNKKIEKMPIKRNDMELYPNNSYGITINIKADDYVDYIEFKNPSVLVWDEPQQDNALISNYVNFTSAGPVGFKIDGQVYNLDENATTLWLNDVPTSFTTNPETAKNLLTMDLSHLDFSQITDMNNMFFGCTSLKELNLDGWDPYELSDMSMMFLGCTSLKELNLAGWDVVNVYLMNSMFEGCTSLKELNLDGWDPFEVTDMGSMFGDCTSLEELNLAGWELPNMQDMSNMFFGCTSLKELNLDGWSIEPSADTDNMFKNINPTVTVYARGCDSTTLQTLRKELPSTATLITE